MNKFKKTELLAPAGKPESLRSAVQNGADAVYLGEKDFSARKNAVNFSDEEMKEAVRYCHIRGVDVHLALNTLIGGDELKKFEKAIMRAAALGVDAVIVQDIGAAEIVKSVCPDMNMHASTQLTACNAYDVEALEKRGFSRVVLSRELSYEEIKHIRKNTSAELEAFVHGALCISFSGKCLMSSFIGGRSGNRGLCAQPCRKCYFSEGKRGFLLSPRDLCLASELNRMIDAGITSFKIEGRMKSPEYVASVTRVYRKYLDSRMPFSEEDETALKKIFVRGDGFTKGYFAGENTPQIMNYSISNDHLTSRADNDELIKMQQTYREGAENKKVFVSGFLTVKENAPSSFSLSDGENFVTEYGKMPEKAINVPLTCSSAQERMAKMGQTPFTLDSFEAELDENMILAASELNRLRRECTERLSEKRSEIHKRNCTPYDFTVLSKKNPVKENLYIVSEVHTEEQFYAASDSDVILIPPELSDKIELNDKCAVLLPQVFLNEEELSKKLSPEKFPKGGYASSPGGILLLEKCGITPFADWGMNIYNGLSALKAAESCRRITLSPELSFAAIKEISEAINASCECVLYGYQTVMTSRACLIRGIRGKCDCKQPLILRDETGAEFKIFADSKTHINTVVNSRPTFMADKLSDIKKAGISGIRLAFTTEDEKRVRKIIAMYKGEIPPVKPEAFTRGYYIKKALPSHSHIKTKRKV